MAFVITKACTKDAACVEVCPVDCIHPTPDEDGFDEVDQLFINPDECIECGACQAECPSDAIFQEDELSDEDQGSIEDNANYYK